MMPDPGFFWPNIIKQEQDLTELKMYDEIQTTILDKIEAIDPRLLIQNTASNLEETKKDGGEAKIDLDETMNLSVGPICLRCSTNRTKLRKRDLKRPFNTINCDVGQKSVMRAIRGVILSYLAVVTAELGALSQPGVLSQPAELNNSFESIVVNFF